MKSFNVLSRNLNIHESYLLEASAGTGKTFSIENIVVRFLIDEKKPLLLSDVLVVTFTKASAADLKFRIRQNIEKNLKHLRNFPSENIPDFLQAVIEKGEKAIFNAEEKLKGALFAFDQAEIFTIHSFCFKMLKTHPLESGICLSANSEESAFPKSEIIRIIRNFFRAGLKAPFFSKEQFNIVFKKQLSNFEKLENELLKAIERGTSIVPGKNFTELFFDFREAFKNLVFTRDKIIADYELQVPLYKKSGDLQEGLLKVTAFANLFEKNELLQDDFNLLIKDGIYFLDALDSQLLRAKADIKGVESKLYYKDLKEKLKTFILPIVQEARSYSSIFVNMAAICQQMVLQYGDQKELFTFDDLLKKMQLAIKNESFVSVARDKYKVLIIDEFQDTDNCQWEIFKTIFEGHAPFYLVGDPKQSIYAFRQADIYTYLKAKDLVPEKNQLSLDTNYRSHEPLVDALNRLFKSTHQWMALPRLNSCLDYLEVKASSKKQDYFFTDGLDSLHFFIVEEAKKNKLKIKNLEENFYFPFIYDQIISLKNQGFALSEMAILVRDHFQAERASRFLKENQIPVLLQRELSLSKSSYVFKFQELLEAVISPKDENVLKKALGGPFIGFSNDDILALKNPLKLEEVLATFFEFRRLFYGSGFLSFFESFLKTSWKGLSVAEWLLSQENGENTYFSLLQIAEILAQEEAKEYFSPEKLLQFLKTFDDLDFNGDSRMKKWKGEHYDAVKVMTIHSSKGLEFDIVFALGLVNETRAPDTFMPHIDENKVSLVAIDAKLDVNHPYIQELNAEKMRQLYVAMTRSCYRLYVPAAFSPEDNKEESPQSSCMDLFLGKLLCRERKQFVDKLDELKISYSDLSEKIISTYTKDELPEKIELIKPEEVKIFFQSICTTSFTQLAKKNKIEIKMNAPKSFSTVEKTVHTLPSSAKVGILLHRILEGVSLRRYHTILDAEELNGYIEPFIYGGAFSLWKDVISQIIFNVLQINFGNFHFKDIDQAKTYSEKEFLYLYEKGFMKGVIDFMFMHDGKYYFIDWKSNWLGNAPTHYSQESMKIEMNKNDYFLQSEIYKEAIKRFLKAADARDFEECFGGAYYVFLRGLDHNAPECGVYRVE